MTGPMIEVDKIGFGIGRREANPDKPEDLTVKIPGRIAPVPEKIVEKTMLTDDYMMGVKKDLDGLKEIKVKLPVRQLVNLHIMKITANRTMQDVVSEALNDFFVKVSQAESADA